MADEKKKDAPDLDAHLVAMGKLAFVGCIVWACALTFAFTLFLCALALASGLSLGWGVGS